MPPPEKETPLRFSLIIDGVETGDYIITLPPGSTTFDPIVPIAIIDLGITEPARVEQAARQIGEEEDRRILETLSQGLNPAMGYDIGYDPDRLSKTLRKNQEVERALEELSRSSRLSIWQRILRDDLI